MTSTRKELEVRITGKFPAIKKDPVQVKEYLTLRVPGPEDLIPVIQWLKTDCGFNYLHMVTAVDYLGPLNLGGFIREPNPNVFLPDGATPQITPPVKAKDYPYRDFIEILYTLLNLSARQTIFLKVDVPRDGGKIPSLIKTFKSSDWQEREIFDLFGTHFTGHPNLKKILTVDFLEGHPLRKDYVHKKDRYDD